MKAATPLHDNDIVGTIETFIRRFVTLSEDYFTLPLALWTIGTYLFLEFDAFPYLIITSDTKQSGKTRLSEILGFMCSNARNFSGITHVIFKLIQDEKPTIFIDEGERLNSEAASMLREFLNIGYKKGQTIPRQSAGGVREYEVYCPKSFILIGDVYDTLRDRSIIVRMRRSEIKRERLRRALVEPEGVLIRDQVAAVLEFTRPAIHEAYLSHVGLDFLTDRDEEIWLGLFAIASVLCPNRLPELSRAAVDMATEKTAPARAYRASEDEEKAALNDQYARKLLVDLYTVMAGNGHVLSSVEAIDKLKAIDTAPWRKFKGDGLTVHSMGSLLEPFGVRPGNCQIGNGRNGRRILRGYKFAAVKAAVEKNHLIEEEI